MEKYLTVQELADHYGVTTATVRNWISRGLEFKIERVIGVKPRKIVLIKDAEDFLKLTKR